MISAPGKPPYTNLAVLRARAQECIVANSLFEGIGTDAETLERHAVVMQAESALWLLDKMADETERADQAEVALAFIQDLCRIAYEPASAGDHLLLSIHALSRVIDFG